MNRGHLKRGSLCRASAPADCGSNDRRVGGDIVDTGGGGQALDRGHVGCIRPDGRVPLQLLQQVVAGWKSLPVAAVAIDCSFFYCCARNLAKWCPALPWR